MVILREKKEPDLYQALIFYSHLRQLLQFIRLCIAEGFLFLMGITFDEATVVTPLLYYLTSPSIN